MSALRAGVIGLGVGMQFAIGLEARSDCVLAALCDLDEVKLREAGARFPKARTFARAEDMLAAADLDLVCVASYDDCHAAQILLALEAGCHVFSEKPLCVAPEDTQAIREALDRRPGQRLSSNLILRLSPRFQALKRDIDGGRLGELFAIEGDYNYGRLWKLTEGWRGQIPDYSVILGGGIHMVDLLLWLSGDRVTEVFAFANGVASRNSSFSGCDLVIALLRFETGLVGKVSANFGCLEPHFHRLLVYGTGGTFENGRDHARLWQSRDPASPALVMDEPYPAVAKHALIPSFVDSILGRGAPVVSATDVFAAMELCHAIDRSVETGQPVPVTHPTAQGAGRRRSA